MERIDTLAGEKEDAQTGQGILLWIGSRHDLGPVLSRAPAHLKIYRLDGIFPFGKLTGPKEDSMSSSGNARDAILDAAETVVREQGAAHLTLDAVSAKAGLSKGGLLYHFRTKDALLEAMLVRLRETFTEARKTEAAKLPEGPAQALKAHILSSEFFQGSRLKGIGAALLAAGAHDPKLLIPAREARDALIKELNTSRLPAEFTAISLLALEGLWILELLGMIEPGREERRAITSELLRLVDVEEARLLAAQGDATTGKIDGPLKDKS